jgi:RHS repeat-associated protein
MTYQSPWGRLLHTSRGPSSGEAVERVEYQYDPDTSVVTSEALQENGTASWSTQRLTESDYDAAGRLVRVILPAFDGDPDPAVEEYEYDPMGRVVARQSSGHDQPNVEYSYDPLGRLLAVRQLSDAGASRWIETTYSYDTHDNLISVTDANSNVTTYGVDDFGDQYRTGSPVSGETLFDHDAAGRLVWKKDGRGVVETRVYDAAGYPTRIVSDARKMPTETVSFAYDHGFRVAATAGTVAEEWSYDRRGLLLRYERSPQSLLFEYDIDGNLMRRLRGQCETVEYQSDWAGRPRAISYTPPDCAAAIELATQVDYLPFGPPRRIRRNAMWEETREFDWRYQLVHQIVTREGSEPSAIVDRTYAYDVAGSLTAVSDQLDPTRNRSFLYDDLGRLTGATGSFGPYDTIAYGYDDIGSRTNRTLIGDQQSLTEEYTAVGSTPMLESIEVTENGGLPSYQSITHDGAGNVIRVGSTRMIYGGRNTLQRTASSGGWMGGGQGRAFEYDADGRLVSRGFGRRFLFPDGRPFFESSRGGGESRVYLGNQLLATIELAGNTPRSVRHVFTDHIGFPLATVTEDGEVWQLDSLPFGGVSNAFEAGDPTLRYPGQWQLWDEGEQSVPLFLNGFRWYHPGWGRYTQSDPIEGMVGLVDVFSQADSTYSYALSNPFTWSDPFGLDEECDPCPCRSKEWGVFGGGWGFSLFWGRWWGDATFTCRGNSDLSVHVDIKCKISGPSISLSLGEVMFSLPEVGPLAFFPGGFGCTKDELLENLNASTGIGTSVDPSPLSSRGRRGNPFRFGVGIGNTMTEGGPSTYTIGLSAGGSIGATMECTYKEPWWQP